MNPSGADSSYGACSDSGGRSYPLIYARVATLIARLSQAMLHEDDWTPSPPPCWSPLRLQLYVDDPVAVARGSPDQHRTTLDMLILFWLLLGIPLSWRKGGCL